MSDQLAQMFYETDIIRFDKNSIDFSKAFSHPDVFPFLADASIEILDDYAIDAIVCGSEVLPYMPHLASRLELPFLWLNGEDIIGDIKDIKRIIYITLVSPSEEDMTLIHELCKKQGLEIIAVYSFLGMRPNTEEPRLLSLVAAGEILEKYKELHLISEKEYSDILNENTAKSENA
ncbi:MAG: hypothetical protein COB02_02515 [Candidatus Cloacimonadota bacterium]|nr:MAG: hypothetical protein COB02_02515 [Candidatus Cloacimonadota bacterium]